MKRPIEHVMEDQAGQLIRQLLPDAWIVRNVPKDYGIDLEVEIVDQDFVTGNRIWVQSKAAKNLESRIFEYDISQVGLEPADVPGAEDGIFRAEYFPHRLDVKELQYALRCTVPLLLFVCDLERRDVLWLPLRDEVLCCLTPSRPGWTKQGTATVRVPGWNNLQWEEEHGYPGLRWYALEPARLNAFAVLHYYYHEFQHTGRLSGYVIGEGFVDHGEEEELRSSLALAKEYLESALTLDVLFGSKGVDYFTNGAPGLGVDPIAVQLAAGVQAAENALAALDGGAYNHMSMALVAGKVSHAINLLSTAITAYQGFRQKFLLTEGSAAWRAGSKFHGLDGPPVAPMDRQRSRGV